MRRATRIRAPPPAGMTSRAAVGTRHASCGQRGCLTGCLTVQRNDRPHQPFRSARRRHASSSARARRKPRDTRSQGNKPAKQHSASAPGQLLARHRVRQAPFVWSGLRSRFWPRPPSGPSRWPSRGRPPSRPPLRGGRLLLTRSSSDVLSFSSVSMSCGILPSLLCNTRPCEQLLTKGKNACVSPCMRRMPKLATYI